MDLTLQKIVSYLNDPQLLLICFCILVFLYLLKVVITPKIVELLPEKLRGRIIGWAFWAMFAIVLLVIIPSLVLNYNKQEISLGQAGAKQTPVPTPISTPSAVAKTATPLVVAPSVTPTPAPAPTPESAITFFTISPWLVSMLQGVGLVLGILFVVWLLLKIFDVFDFFDFWH